MKLNKKGITLIEIMIMVVVISVLAISVYTMTRPSDRIGQADDAVRVNDSIAIEKAIKTSIAANKGLPTNLAAVATNTPVMIVSEGGSISGLAKCNAIDQEIARVDIAGDFKNQIGEIPVDNEATGVDTGYYVTRMGNLFNVESCNTSDDGFDYISMTLYGGDESDYLYGVYSDNAYTYAVGNTGSEGAGNIDSLIVKFDSDLNIVARKVYGGTGNDFLERIYSDGTYIYAVGYTQSEGESGKTALIIKFDINLNIVARKIYDNSYDNNFAAVVSDGTYIYAGGYTRAIGNSYEALLIKFDSSLNIVSSSIYKQGGSTQNQLKILSLYYDGTNIYASGVASNGWDSLVAKIDTNLNILTAKTLTHSGSGSSKEIYSDGTNTYVAGYTAEGVGPSGAYIAKLDTDFNLVAKKIYSGDGAEYFFGVGSDAPYIYAVGYTSSEGEGNGDFLIVKFDSDLNIVDRKVFGSNTWEISRGIHFNNDYLYVAGYSAYLGSYYATLSRVGLLPSSDLSSTPGGFSITDSNLSLTNSVMYTQDFTTTTPLSSGFALSDSGLELENSGMTQTIYEFEE